jgi:hypothetical protein
MVGKGTPSDPRRPQYAPWPASPNPSRTEIVGFSHQVSDDGRFALVEFVARDRSAFRAILNDKSITVYEKGKDKRDDIEKALKKFNSALGTAAAYFQEWRDLNNRGDINLGIAASALGAALRAGSVSMGDVGQTIRQTLCKY